MSREVFVADGELNATTVYSCTLPNCDGSMTALLQNSLASWGNLRAFAHGSNGFIYFAHGDGRIRKLADDGANINADVDAVVVHVGLVVSGFSRLDGKLYWTDSALEMWSLDLDGDVVAKTGFVFHTTSAVSSARVYHTVLPVSDTPHAPGVAQVNSFVLRRNTAVTSYGHWTEVEPATTVWSFTDSQGNSLEGTGWSARQDPYSDTVVSLNASSVNPHLNSEHAVLGLYTAASAPDSARISCRIKALGGGAGLVFAFQDVHNFYFLSASTDSNTRGDCAPGPQQTW